MKDIEIAQLLSGQTAIISRLCQILIAKEVVSRDELTDEMHDLLSIGSVGGVTRATAPIMHLLDILEKPPAKEKI